MLEPVVAVTANPAGVLGGETSGMVVSTTSTGLLLVVSLLLRLSVVGLGVVTAMVAAPVALTTGVTSTLVQLPDRKDLIDPMTVAETGGAFAYVMVDSCQELSATARTSYPTSELVTAY